MPIKVTAIRRLVRHIWQAEAAPAGEVDVAVVDDDAITEMAGRFGHEKRPTDVLSFTMNETCEPIAAQVVVSAETAIRQAGRRKLPIEAELMLYIVHGLLHQIGYDDRQPADAAKMHRREDDLLIDLGYGPVYKGS